LASDTEARIHAIKNPFTDPELVSTKVKVPKWLYPPNRAENNGGSGRTLDTLDARIINVHWREGNLFAGHGVGLSGLKPRTTARWYEFNTGDWPDSGSVTLAQSGNITSQGWVWFPALYSNKSGEVAAVVAHSDTDKFASVEVTGRNPEDGNGKMRTLTRLHIGESSYSGRWGDYFDITVDPNNDMVFWVIGEYARSDGGWGTWIDSFLLNPIRGDMNCDARVDFDDIDPWVLALSNEDEYRTSYAGCDPMLGDANCDGELSFDDVDAFVECLLNGSCPTCE
jgi:hypothetical protein